MKILELFCGTKSFSNVAKELGHETFTLDFEKKFNPDLCIDILDFNIDMLPEKWKHPDVIWASPPCTTFSVASIYIYWDKGKPKNDKCLHGISIVKKTLEIIEMLKPKYFFIENPRGMLRKQEFMQNLPKNTVTYCQYGLQWQKATDIWTNCDVWKPKPMCSPKAPCHIRSPRGSSFGVQGIKARVGYHPDGRYVISRSAEQRAIVPKDLCLEILNSINPHTP